MGTSRALKTIIRLLITLVATGASPAIAHGSNLKSERMEARGLCSSGACLGNLDARGISQLKSLVQKISIMDEDDRTYKAKTGKDIGFAAIGGIAANQELVNPFYDPKDPKFGPKTIKGAMATATLVSPCHVLTNYHAVAGGAKSPKAGDQRAAADFASKYTAKFYVGPTGDNLHDVNAKPVKWGNFMPGGNIDQDWMLLEIDNCVGLDPKIGWMEMDGTKDSKATSMQLAMAGYPADRDRTQLSIDPNCRVVGLTHKGGVWEHTCANRRGASGSPLVYLDDDNVPHMIAMNSNERLPLKGEPTLGLDPEKDIIPSADPKSSSYMNRAVNMSKVYDEIRSTLDVAKDHFKKENPVLAKLKNGGSEVSPASLSTAPSKKAVSSAKKPAGTDI